jgi:uncharacterized membrane protein YfcA
MSEFILSDLGWPTLALALFSLALGGVLKGATGAGAPVVAIPALALLYDVKLAVVIMMVPNLLTNVWQLYQFKSDLMPGRLVSTFSIAGATGALLGSWLLSWLPQTTLSLIVATSVFGFIAFRLLNANWVLSYENALKISIPVGLVAGTLQGSSGISGPVSLSFFNSMGLERPTFIANISVFFIAMTLAQIPALMSLGLMKPHHFLAGAIAMAPIVLFMPFGNFLAKRFSKNVFDRLMLILLLSLAIKLVIDH